jgi:formate dehydrogenase iron-sulfur subunit
VDSKNKNTRAVSSYVNHVYGLNEAGGTQYLLLAGVPFEVLGFDKSINETLLPDLTWAYISKIPTVIATVLVGGAATYAITHRKDKD